MSFKSKGPKSQPSKNPKANPKPPKPTPEKDSKSATQKPNQKPKLQPGKNRQDKNQKPKTNPSEENKNIFNIPQVDLNKNAKNIISNLTPQLNKTPSEPPTKSPLEPNKDAKNRITRPIFKPNIIQNGRNRITRPNFKPGQHKGSKNIISRLIFDPNKASPNKNKITRPKFDPNDEAKNKIRKYTLEPSEKSANKITRYKVNPVKEQNSNNKIRRISFKPNNENKNTNDKISAKPKLIKNTGQPVRIKPTPPPTEITKNKIIKPEPLKQPQKETRKNITKSRWAFLNYDAQGNPLSREDKIQHAVNYFNDTILPELRRDSTIARRINTQHTIGSNDLINKKYSGFLNALSREHKIKWSELKSTIGHIEYKPLSTTLEEKSSPNTKPKTEFNLNYGSINYDDNYKPLDREKKLEKAIDLFNQKILPELENIPKIKEKLDKGKGVSYRDLEVYGFGQFHNAVNRSGIKIGWNEFKREAGHKINIDQEKYKFLNYDQNNQRLLPEEKLNVAIEHYQKIIIPDLMKIPKIKQKIEIGNPPAIDDLIAHGHPGFIAPLSQKEPKIHYNTLIEAAGFHPNVDHDKYRFLNYNEQGNSHSYDQKMETAKEFLNTNIIPKLIEKDLIKPGETPGIREISRGGFSGFFPSLAFKGQKIDYNELVKNAELKPNITHGRWDFIKYDHNGNILSKEEKLANALDYFNRVVYHDLVQKGVVRQGEPPTSLNLQDYKHQDFLSALCGKDPKVSFNHFVEYAGFQPKSPQDHEKWKIFYDNNGKPLLHHEQIKIAVNYFKSEIIQDLLSKGAIEKNQTPDVYTLKEFGHNDFFKATNRRGILYEEILNQAGFSPNNFNTLSAIGMDFHWTAEKIFLEHTRKQNNCNSFYEVKGNSDNSIYVDENFKNLSNGADLFTNIRPDIKIVNFEYFLSNSEEVVMMHSQREYQGEGKALFHIPLNANKPYAINKDVPHSNNVFILNPKGFAEFMGYKGEVYDKFMESVNLAKNSIHDEDSREILSEMKIEAFNAIKNNENDLNYSTKEFKNFLNKPKES